MQFAPSNHKYSGGSASTNPNNSDYNEIDGWIIILASEPHEHDTDTITRTSDDEESNDVSIPFHMIVRKVANATMDASTSILNDDIFDSLPMNVSVDMKNHCADAAQIDSFQLLYI